MAGRKVQTAGRRHQEIFRAPPLPGNQGICDVIAFQVGKATFVAVTALCFQREKPSSTRIFRMSSSPPFLFDPEPVLTLSLYHPRNIALSPEKDGARWLWIADHGPDQVPFPGGCCPLYRVHESGEVKRKDDPLLQKLQFSFDGCFWEEPGTGALFLYQSNIGQTAPRLLRWKNMDGPAEELSASLPAGFLDRQERFLVSRVLASDEAGVDLFLGGDYSDPMACKYERDLVLRVPYSGDPRRSPHPVPPRLKDRSWSTVEAVAFDKSPGGPAALLAIYHDFGFTEGVAEVLEVDKSRLARSRRKLPLPSLEGQRTWIARGAIGDLDGDGRNDIVLYLRGTDGAMPESRNNLFLLRQNSSGGFDYAVCQDTGYQTHFAGGFFAGGELFQVRFDGVIEQTWFSF